MYTSYFHNSASVIIAYVFVGAVPIVTLNLQNGIAPGIQVPDAWHHQMSFGVGPRGIYLTNPLECVTEAALWPQLCSPSVLLVRRSDILARWNEHTSLRPLMTHPDHRWKMMNVLGMLQAILTFIGLAGNMLCI